MTGILAVYNDVDPEHESQFNQWYNRQHILERVSVDGFLSGRRYRAIQATHAYFAWYETESTDVLYGADYRQRLEDPTHWTREVMPRFRNMVRTVMHRSCRLGEGTGSVVASLAYEPDSTEMSRDWLAHDGLGEIVDGVDIIGAECWLRDDSHSDQATTESRLRGGTDQTLAATIVIHATSVEAPLATVDSLSEGLRRYGAHPAESLNRYGLIFAA